MIFVVPLELKKGILVCLAVMNCMNSCLFSQPLYALFWLAFLALYSSPFLCSLSLCLVSPAFSPLLSRPPMLPLLSLLSPTVSSNLKCPSLPRTAVPLRASLCQSLTPFSAGTAPFLCTRWVLSALEHVGVVLLLITCVQILCLPSQVKVKVPVGAFELL